MQGSGIDLTPARLPQHCERRVFVVIAFVVSKVRQAIVIADQIAVNVFGSGDGAAACPGILAQPLLNTELTFD